MDCTEREEFFNELRRHVGPRYLLTGRRQTAPYRAGFRSEAGDAIAVIRPGSHSETWQVLKTCVDADVIVLFQAANTGLTGGSNPASDYDRPVVIISTTRVSTIVYLPASKQVLASMGARLDELEKLLAGHSREPHSVIGSSCIGASVVGGVCNSSGGALVQRGPAYSEMALYARVNQDGTLELVNELGIDLGKTPDEILRRLDDQSFDINVPRCNENACSSESYAERVRDTSAPTPARYNADPANLHGVSGCGGKLAVFCVRLDTFRSPDRKKTVILGSNSIESLSSWRHDVLGYFEELPISAEYMSGETVRVADSYGRDTVLMLGFLGSGTLSRFFNLKRWLDRALETGTKHQGLFSERILQSLSRLLPSAIRGSLGEFLSTYQHYVLVTVSGRAARNLDSWSTTVAPKLNVEVFQCTSKQASLAGRLRYAAAGASIRLSSVDKEASKEVLALDVALPRNARNFVPEFGEHIDRYLHEKIFYGHFLCNVFHYDFVLKKGADSEAVKTEMLNYFDKYGAKYPAEHNVGHSYVADPCLASHYRSIDPLNVFNSGIGKMSKNKAYK